MPKTVIEPRKARQGRNGTRVLIVLLCGLALAMLVWWGVEMFGRTIAPDEPASDALIEEQAPAQPEAPAPPQ